MARARGKRFTIYDAMEDRGEFEKNTANKQAKTHDGRRAYRKEDFPMMLYHPKGEETVTVRPVAEVTPFGPQMLNEQRRLITKVVGNEEELEAALAEGWHDRPGKAVAARTGEAYTESPAEEVDRLRKEIEELKASASQPAAGSKPSTSKSTTAAVTE